MRVLLIIHGGCSIGFTDGEQTGPVASPTKHLGKTMNEYLSEYDMRQLLFKACKQAGSQRAWAEANHLGQSFVSDVLAMKRPVSEEIAAALGYRRLIKFQRKQ